MWVSVLVARLIGGVIGGYAGYAVLHGSPSDAQVFVPALVTAAVTGVGITLLLPGLSGRTIGSGSAAMAAFVGAVAPLIAGFAVTRGAFAPSSQGVLILGGGAPLLVISTNVVGVAITAWMVSTSATAVPAVWRSDAQGPPRPRRELDAVEGPSATREPDPIDRGYWGSMEERDRAA